MSRVIPFALICLVGLFGCGGSGSEEPAMDASETEMAEDMAMINAEVASISEDHANINTNVTQEQLMAAGFSGEGWVSVTHNDQTIVMMMVDDYGDVAEGDWLARIDEDGAVLQIAVNMGNAATDLGVAVGDVLHIMAAEAPDMGEDMDDDDGGGEEDADEGEASESEEAATQPAE